MSSPVLPPPPLDHPLEDRSGRAAVPWARWLQQLWDVNRNVVDSTASTHSALTLVNVGATGAPNAKASTISAAQVLELELATTVFPGLLTASGFSKLEGIATGATAEVDADGTHAGRVTLGAQVLGSGTKTVDALVSTGAITAGGVAVLTQTNTVAGITNKTFTTPTINGATVSGTFAGPLTLSVGATSLVVTSSVAGDVLQLKNTNAAGFASIQVSSSSGSGQGAFGYANASSGFQAGTFYWTSIVDKYFTNASSVHGVWKSTGNLLIGTTTDDGANLLQVAGGFTAVTSWATGAFVAKATNMYFWKDATPTKQTAIGPLVPGGSVTDDLIFSLSNGVSWVEAARFTYAKVLAIVSGGDVTVGGTSVALVSGSTLTSTTLTSPTINGATLTGTLSGGTFTSTTLTTPTINGAALSGTFSGTPTFSGAVTMSSSLDLAGLLNINNTILIRTGTNGLAFWKTSSGGNAANIGMSVPGGAATDDLILSTSDTFTWSERMRIANGGAITMGGTLAVTSTISASNFSGTHSGASSGTNTGDFTLAAVGTNPNANGATRSAQVLNLELASASFPGLITAAQFTKLLSTSGTNTGDSPLTVKDEGSTLSSAVTSIDFVGGGVVATNTGGAVTVTIGTTTATTLTSATANPSSAGIVRLANADAIGWRNNANSGNLLLGATSSDRLSFSSDNVVTAGSTDTLTNKTLSAAALTGTFTGSASFTGTLTITTNIINGSIRSSTASPASGGMIRLANNLDGIFWRNNANTTDLGLIANSSDRLQFAGVTLVGTSTTDTLTAKTLTTPTINGAALYGTLSGSPDFSGAPTIASSPVLTNDVAGPGVVPGGRLTLTTGVPVTTSDVTGVTTHYYAPYLHNRIQLWDGTRWQWWTFSQLSQVSTDTTKSPAAVSSGNNYDIFVWSDSGTLRATRGPAWTSGTARGTGVGTTELLAQDGRYLNKIAITNGPAASRGLYVGTLHTGPSGFYDTKRLRWCWNMFNRVSRQILQVESTASWNYTTATDRPANNTTTNSIEMVRGLDEDAVSAQLIGSCVNTSTGVTVLVSFGLDSTSVRATGSGATLASIATAVVNGRTPLVANYSGCPGLGYHYLQWLEFSVATGVTTWFGANETGITGLAVS